MDENKKEPNSNSPKDSVFSSKSVFDIDNGLELKIDPDGLIATISVRPYMLTAREVSISDIYYTFERYNISTKQVLEDKIKGILAEINEIIQKKENLKEILTFEIAKGTPPVEGEDGWIKFLFPRAKRVTIKEDGTADFRNIERYVHVKKSDKAAIVFEGTNGKDGINVYGDVIHPKPIKKPKLIVGKNISSSKERFEEDPNKTVDVYYSTCDGVIFTTENSVTVSPELNIETDVGLETGNINFEGTIRVKGNIVEGAVVNCKSNLFVSGNVESNEIQVAENLEVKGGIKCKDKSKGKIIVKGDLNAKFIENANVEVHGDLVIENYILHSNIHCLGTIFISSDTGSIITSDIVCYQAVSVSNLGSSAQLDTTLEVGFHFLNDSLFTLGSEKLKSFQAELEEIEPKLIKIKEVIQRSRGKLDEAKKLEFKNYFEAYAKKKKAVDVFAFKLDQLKTERFNSEPVKVVVRHGAFPGVTIKYRRQIEKIFKYQSSFMLNFFPSQEKAVMVAWKSKKD